MTCQPESNSCGVDLVTIASVIGRVRAYQHDNPVPTDASARQDGRPIPSAAAADDPLQGWRTALERASGRREPRLRYAEILSIQEDALGPDHPDTLVTKLQLAAELMKAGEGCLARTLFEEVTRRTDRLLGPRPDVER